MSRDPIYPLDNPAQVDEVVWAAMYSAENDEEGIVYNAPTHATTYECPDKLGPIHTMPGHIFETYIWPLLGEMARTEFLFGKPTYFYR